VHSSHVCRMHSAVITASDATAEHCLNGLTAQLSPDLINIKLNMVHEKDSACDLQTVHYTATARMSLCTSSTCRWTCSRVC